MVEEAADLRDQEDGAGTEEGSGQPHQASCGGELGWEDRDPGQDTSQLLSGERQRLTSGLPAVVEGDEGEVARPRLTGLA